MSNLAVSRRAVTRALAVLPVIAIPAVAGATSRAGEHGDNDMNAITTIAPASPQFDPRSRDRAFWRALDQWQALVDEFEATDSEDDAVWNDYGARINDELRELADLPVSTFAAWFAKRNAIGEIGYREWQDGATFDDRLDRDAMRLIKAEAFGANAVVDTVQFS